MGNVVSGVGLGHFGKGCWPSTSTRGKFLLKFLLETRLKSKSFEPLIGLLGSYVMAKTKLGQKLPKMIFYPILVYTINWQVMELQNGMERVAQCVISKYVTRIFIHQQGMCEMQKIMKKFSQFAISITRKACIVFFQLLYTCIRELLLISFLCIQ